MAVTVFDTCNKRKRNPRIFGFRTFASPDSQTDHPRPFRENIRRFVEEFGESVDYTVSGNPTWCTMLVSETNGVVFPIYTVEESVKHSSRPFCDVCRCVGWSHHFVSKRRYHLIIPKDEEWTRPLKKGSLKIHTHLLHGVIHCNGFGHLLCINGMQEGSNYLCGDKIMNLWDRICTTLRTRKMTVHDVSKKRSMDLRLLHGVAYGRSWFGKWGYKFCNGSFGVTEHIYHRAIQILSSLDLDKILNDFTNTDKGRVVKQIICTYKDVSQTELINISDLLQFMLDFISRAPVQRKTAMALASISSKSASKPTQHQKTLIQDNPIETALALATFSSKSASTRPTQQQENPVEDIPIEAAMALAAIASECATRQNQKPKLPLQENPIESSTFSLLTSDSNCRWPSARLEYAANIIVRALKEKKANVGGTTMSRQELRDSIRQYIGDTGLIDFVLKSINNTMVGNHIIRRSSNPVTRLLEFSLQEVVDDNEFECERKRELHTLVRTDKESDTLARTNSESHILAIEPGLDVYEDVLYLYENVLLGYSESHPVGLATRAIMDTKHFVKEWQYKDNLEDDFLSLICQVLPSYDELVSKFTRPLPPGELLVVPQCLTVGKLKMLVQCALRDTYCIMEHIVVRDLKIDELDKRKQQEVLTSTAGSGAQIWVRGSGLDLATELRYEGGIENWMVDCNCGAGDDDGERMVACDVCQVWQHTRCNGIEDDRAVPSKFLCGRCTAVKYKV